jgi:tetratricopeptide (TPR) repeat protein
MAQMTVEQAIELGMQYLQAGQVQQAEAIYRQVLAARPNHPDTLNMLGIIALQAGKLDQAEQFIRSAIAANPAMSDYHRALGQVLASGNHLSDAIGEFRQALALRPNSAQAANDLGNALLQAGQSADALAALQKATALSPDSPEAWTNLGNALRQSGQVEEAVAAARRAVELNPNFPQAQYNLGNHLRDDGEPEASVECYRQALRAAPGYANAQINLATVLKDLGRYDQAIAGYRQALKLAPNDALAHANFGATLLLTGKFQEGWSEYEWRGRVRSGPMVYQEFAQPRWDGGALNGKRILIHAEQGFGDTIQFARYLSLVAERGGKVIFQCQSELLRLFRFQDRFRVDQIVGRDEALAEFDVHCPLVSLPRAFATTFDTIPAATPYVKVDPELSSRWRARMPADSLKVGLAWAGSPTHKNDRNRSLTPDLFAPLTEVAKVHLISLQKRSDSSLIPHSSSFPLLDWTSELTDFADTAALIDNLDLVITADTAVAHLAGAMGKPVWMLLPFVPDWRWMLDRADSPWYPSMRLFRQKEIGQWQAPIEQLLEELRCRS